MSRMWWLTAASRASACRSRYPGLVAERGEDGLLGIDALAENYWNIHKQPRSAWTQELDLRPYKESF